MKLYIFSLSNCTCWAVLTFEKIPFLFLTFSHSLSVITLTLMCFCFSPWEIQQLYVSYQTRKVLETFVELSSVDTCSTNTRKRHWGKHGMSNIVMPLVESIIYSLQGLKWSYGSFLLTLTSPLFSVSTTEMPFFTIIISKMRHPANVEKKAEECHAANVQYPMSQSGASAAHVACATVTQPLGRSRHFSWSQCCSFNKLCICEVSFLPFSEHHLRYWSDGKLTLVLFVLPDHALNTNSKWITFI